MSCQNRFLEVLSLAALLALVVSCSDKSAEPGATSTAGAGGVSGGGQGGSSTVNGGEPATTGGNPAGGAPAGGESSGGATSEDGGLGGEGTADAGAGGAASAFPDDGLPRDPTFSAGSVPQPTAVADFPMLLSQTGLYADTAKGVFAYDVRLFAPQFELWSDSATKRRWFYLPEGEKIDTTDMDNWRYPIGTKLWKEFSRDGKRIETRIIWRVKAGGLGWVSVAYIWNADQTDAVAAPTGLQNASGTNHDVPNQQACKSCHGERSDQPLGFSAVQLSHAGAGLNLSELIARDLLTLPPAGNFAVPGNTVERAALGYMHANCGGCHRVETSAAIRGDLRMWLLVDQLSDLQKLDTYTYLVNKNVFAGTSVYKQRVVGGAPEASEVLRRMQLRQPGDIPMPQLGTEDVDPTGVKVITDWVNALPPPPPPLP